MKQTRGFTLLELIAVVSILAIAAALVLISGIPVYIFAVRTLGTPSESGVSGEL